MSFIADAYVRIRPLVDAAFSRDIEREITPGLRRAERAAQSTNREFARFSRGALVGTGALHQLGRAAAFASTSFIGGAGVVFALKSASAAASSLNEQTSRAGVVFEKAAGQVEDFAEGAAAIGLARDQALRAASEFGTLFANIGTTAQRSADLSEQIVRLGSDLASFADTPVPDALAAIRSGLTGEVEPLRRYGVFLSEAQTQQDAFRRTGKSTTAELTTQDRVLSRLNLIMRQTTLAQGDFARTSDNLANQQRILQANVRNLQIALGEALNPQLTEVVQRLNAWLSSTENQEKVQREFEHALKDGLAIVEGFARGLDTIRTAVGPLIRLVGGLTDAIELLVIALAVSKVARFAGLLGGGPGAAAAAGVVEEATVAGAATAATVKVTALRVALLRLGAIGAVAIAIDLIVNTGLGGRYSGKQGWVNLFHDIGDLAGGSKFSRIFGKGGSLAAAAQAPDTGWTAFFEGIVAVAHLGRVHAFDQLETLRGTRDLDRRVGPDLPERVKGQTFIGRPLTALEAIRQAVAAAKLTPGTADDVRALSAQRAQYQRALDFALKQLDLEKGNTGQFAKDAEKLTDDIAGINTELAQIATANAQKAAEAREKAILALGLGRGFKGVSDAPGAFESLRTGLLQGTLGTFKPGGRANVVVPGIPPELALRLQIAEQNTTNEKKLIPLLQTEAGIVANQLRLLKKTGATELAVLSATLDLATIRRRIRDIRKQDARDAFTTQDLFSEAGSTFAKYGSNVGDLTTALSPQEAGGAAVRAARTLHITQVFPGEQPNPAQAMQSAANAARALRYG